MFKKKDHAKISPVRKTNPPSTSQHPVITVTEANPSTPTGVKVQIESNTTSSVHFLHPAFLVDYYLLIYFWIFTRSIITEQMEKEEERRLRRVRWIVRVPIPISSIPLKIFRKPRALPTLSTKMADSICTSSWKLFTRWRHGLTSVLSAFVRHPSAFWNCFWTWAWSLHPSHRPIIPAAINTTTTIAISNSSSNSKPEMDCWVSTKKNFHVTRTVFVLTLSPECSSTSDARTVAVTPGVIRLPILYALRAYFWWLNFTAYPANTSDPSYVKRSYADTLWSKWLTFFMPSSVSVSIQDLSSRQSVNN